MNLIRVLIMGLALSSAAIAQAQDYDFNNGVGYDQGDWRGRPRPPRPDPGYPPPPRYNDLCQGTYFGSYANGWQAYTTVQPQGGGAIAVSIQVTYPKPASFTAYGSCNQWGDHAQITYTLSGRLPVVHRGVINYDYYGRAVMTGHQDNGYDFTFTR